MAAERLLQGTQGVRTTDVIVRRPHIGLTKAARLQQDNRAFIARLSYDAPLCLAKVSHILQDHLATALHVNVSTTIARLPNVLRDSV